MVVNNVIVVVVNGNYDGQVDLANFGDYDGARAIATVSAVDVLLTQQSSGSARVSAHMFSHPSA